MRRLLALFLLSASGLFAQHAYWRLLITLNPTSNLCVIDLIEFHDAGGSVIATTGGTASASDTQGGNVAANAFDGSVNGAWWVSNSSTITPSTPSWIQYHFSSAVSVASARLYARQNFSSQQPSDVALQYSDNGSTFTTLYQYYGLYEGGNSTDGGGNHYWNLNSSLASPTFGGTSSVAATIAYRLNITADTSSTAVTLTSLTFKNCSGSTISTPAAAAPVSSLANDDLAGFAPYNNVFRWQSNGTPSGGSPEYIEYIFGSATTVSQFTIATFSTGSSPTAFSLQHSTDGTTWTTDQSFTTTWPNTSAQTFTVTSACSAPTQIGGFLVQ